MDDYKNKVFDESTGLCSLEVASALYLFDIVAETLHVVKKCAMMKMINGGPVNQRKYLKSMQGIIQEPLLSGCVALLLPLAVCRAHGNVGTGPPVYNGIFAK